MLNRNFFCSICKCIRYDWHYGTLCEWKKFLPVFLIMVFSCIRLSVIFYRGQDVLEWKEVLSIGDFVFWNFKGMEIVTDFKNSFFVLDGIWIFFHIYLAYIIGFYPSRDMKNNNHILMIRSERRACWWIGKCIWSLSNVFIYYVTAFAAIYLSAVVLGKNGWAVQEQVMKKLYEIEFYNSDTICMYAACIGISFMISAGISFVQMTVSLILNPVVGFSIAAAVLTISVYVFNLYLPGNYLMLLRNEMYLPGIGAGMQQGFWLALFMIILAATVGYVLFRKKDIYPDKVR